MERAASAFVGDIRGLWNAGVSALRGGQDTAAEQASADEIRVRQARFARLLDAAGTDGWEVAEVLPAWRAFEAQASELTKTLVRWRYGLQEHHVRNIDRLAPGLPSFLEEIRGRLTDIDRMLSGEAPARPPGAARLEPDAQELAALSHFERAAATSQFDRLRRIEILTRALLGSARAIKDVDADVAPASEAPGARPAQLSPGGVPVPDLDHLAEATRAAASVWLMFLAIVYIPGVPAGLGALGIATRFAFVGSSLPSFGLDRLYGPAIAAMICVFPFYALVLPRLSGFAELAAAISLVVFGLVYVFKEPRQTGVRSIFAYLFFSLIGISNEQTYSFMHYVTTVMRWMVNLAVLSITEYVPISHRPDQVFRRLLRRFFRSGAFLLQLGRTPERERSLLQRLSARFHAYEIATLPNKLTQWGASLPPCALGASTPGELQAFMNRIMGLGCRLQALLEARGADQSEALVRELREDVKAWRSEVESLLQALADDPEAADPDAVRARLGPKLAHLDRRLEETLNGAVGAGLTAAESEDMYRLLGAHRGVTDSLADLTRHAAAIDRDRLREARF